MSDLIRDWQARQEAARAAYLLDHHCACGAVTVRAAGGRRVGVRCNDCKEEKNNGSHA